MNARYRHRCNNLAAAVDRYSIAHAFHFFTMLTSIVNSFSCHERKTPEAGLC